MFLGISRLQVAGGALQAAETKPLLRAVPPQPILPKSTAMGGGGMGLNLSRGDLTVQTAIRQNILDNLGTPVAPTSSASPSVGSAGSADNAGNIAGAAGNVGYAVDAFANWQVQNPTGGLIARIGLPVVGAYLITKGHVIFGGAAIVASLPLWYARLKK